MPTDEETESTWQDKHPVLGMVVETVAGIEQQGRIIRKLVMAVEKLDARVYLLEKQLVGKRKRKASPSPESKRLNACDENDKAEGST